jgi:hypothetical protein
VSRRALRDSYLADLRTARDSLEQLRKLHHETNLAFLRLTEAVNKRSINADDTEGNDEDPGEGEEEEDSKVEINGEDMGYEGTSEGEDKDSSDFNTSSIGASSNSPRPSTSPDTSPPQPISDILASVWGNGFA